MFDFSDELTDDKEAFNCDEQYYVDETMPNPGIFVKNISNGITSIEYISDGHDIKAIQKVCEQILHSERKKPIALVFHTSKGRGVSFMEGHPEWHYGILDDITYNKAIQELK